MGKRNRVSKTNGLARVLSDELNLVESVIVDLYTHDHSADLESQKKKSQQLKPRNCRRDAYCIQRLGMEKWDKLRKDRSKTPAPNLKRREIAAQPCGLENFGNFCYVNSFLQIWFNDLVFRKCIFEWREVPDFRAMGKMDIQKVMNCLQRLFITMQITPYEFTNATELTELLMLDNEQHDVQEFSILFFDALDRNLASHPNGEKCRQLFRRRFEGKTRQIVSCECGKSSVSEIEFRSLQLHINGANSLTAALADYFAPEQLTDCRCDVCGEEGGVQRATECVVVPPVLMLQLNRYSFDQNGRSKKITSPVQFPRQLPETALRRDADPESNYELCAVMIHEGQNASCGHYYDLVKDPNSNQWFSYNDREVTECQRTPGVTAEKSNVQRGTVEMKGCYALIYRKSENKPEDVVVLDSQKTDLRLIEVLSLAPSQVVREIEQKLSAKFQDESREGNRSHEIWSTCIDDRHRYLEHMWNCLSVHDGQLILKKPDSIAFLPADLLVEIQQKEFQAVQKMKDLDKLLNGTSTKIEADDDAEYVEEALERLGPHLPDEETEEEYTIRLMETTAQIREERQTTDRMRSAQIRANSTAAEPPDDESLKLLYVMEPLSGTRMNLCRHGKVDFEQLKDGHIKAVTRRAAEQLLDDYQIGVRLEHQSRMEENGEPSETEPTSLMSGSDLCTECIEQVQREEETRRDLDSRCVKAEEILKRFAPKNQDYIYPTSDAFYVSRAQLKTYKKLAIQEMSYQKSKGAGAPGALVFSSKFRRFQEIQKSPVKSNGVDESGDADQAVEVPTLKRRRIDSASTNGDEQMEKPPRSALSKFSSSSDSPSPVQSPKRDRTPMPTSQESEVKKEEVEDVPMDQEDANSAPSVGGESANLSPTDDEAEIEIVGEVIRNPIGPVVFNGDLICVHGGVDCNVKKVWIFENEWNQLVKGKFEHVRVLPCTTTVECPKCVEVNNTNECVKSDCAAKLTQLSQTIGKSFRAFEKRCSVDGQVGPEFTMALCGKFPYRFRHAAKGRTSSVPKMCQECLLCVKHGRPFMRLQEATDSFEQLRRIDEASAEVSGTRSLLSEGSIGMNSSYEKHSVGPLPVSEEEWSRLNLEYANVCGKEEESPKEIRVESGEFIDLCAECNEQFNQILHQMRCDYPQGANIYVKLKEDEDETTKPSSSRGATATRRTTQKNIHRTKLTSENTIRELKLKLYERTRQTPSDQLIYCGDRLLDDKWTLKEAGVYGDNENEPLTLITQQHAEINETERKLEKGFRDTALSTFV